MPFSLLFMSNRTHKNAMVDLLCSISLRQPGGLGVLRVLRPSSARRKRGPVALRPWIFLGEPLSRFLRHYSCRRSVSRKLTFRPCPSLSGAVLRELLGLEVLEPLAERVCELVLAGTVQVQSDGAVLMSRDWFLTR